MRNRAAIPRIVSPRAAENLAGSFLPRGFTVSRAAEAVRRLDRERIIRRCERKGRPDRGTAPLRSGEERYWLFWRLRKRGMSIGSRLKPGSSRPRRSAPWARRARCSTCARTRCRRRPLPRAARPPSSSSVGRRDRRRADRAGQDVVAAEQQLVIRPSSSAVELERRLVLVDDVDGTSSTALRRRGRRARAPGR